MGKGNESQQVIKKELYDYISKHTIVDYPDESDDDITNFIGEMLVGPAKALFMDEISNGLDSSTTFQIVNSLKQFVHILKETAVISLLQPAPETYNLFDDIILLSDGYIVYQGPREHVLEFFHSIGFKCPERKGVADFLQQVSVNLSTSSQSTLINDINFW